MAGAPDGQLAFLLALRRRIPLAHPVDEPCHLSGSADPAAPWRGAEEGAGESEEPGSEEFREREKWAFCSRRNSFCRCGHSRRCGSRREKRRQCGSRREDCEGEGA